jgi:hypothetical protein
MREIQKTKEEWQQELTGQQCFVLFEKGTERPFSHPYNDNKEKGTYVCAACGTPLFQFRQPSMTRDQAGQASSGPIASGNVEEMYRQNPRHDPYGSSLPNLRWPPWATFSVTAQNQPASDIA